MGIGQGTVLLRSRGAKSIRDREVEVRDEMEHRNVEGHWMDKGAWALGWG